MAPKKKKARQQRPLENEILDPEIVLKEVRRCKALLDKQKPIDESTVDLSAYRVVKEMTGDKVAKEIHDLFLKCAESILAGNSFKFDVPSRAAGNQHYVPELDRIVLKQNTSERSFANVSQVRKTAIMTRVLSLVHEVTTKGIHVTKRDLFYTDVKLFKKQEESDAVLDDAACMIGCPRSCLNVVAADKGLVVGRLQFREDGDLIDCPRLGVTGKAIPFIKAASSLRRRRRVEGVPVGVPTLLSTPSTRPESLYAIDASTARRRPRVAGLHRQDHGDTVRRGVCFIGRKGRGLQPLSRGSVLQPVPLHSDYGERPT